MKKFRQFIMEAKKKKKKLSDHELKHGIATQFIGHDHSSKKKLKEQFSFDPPAQAFKPKQMVVADHIKRTKPNEHLFTDSTKYMSDRSHADRAGAELERKYNYHKTPHLDDVSEYTSSSYEINKGLYDSHVDGHHHSDMTHKSIEHWGDSIKNLDKATTHHELKHPLTVYSGVTKRVPEDAAKHPERKVYHPGFVSTSLDAHTASNFTKPSLGQHDDVGEHHVLRIHLKPGHKMLHIGKNSNYPNENEVLLPRGHTFKISDKPVETHDIQHQWNSTKKERLHIWDAHIEHTLEDRK